MTSSKARWVLGEDLLTGYLQYNRGTVIEVASMDPGQPSNQ
jgi:hypothetical protein